MKAKILSLALGASILLLGACGDDNPSPKERFSFDGETIALKNANIYLTYIGTYEGRSSREYIITDGTFSGGDFTGATYFAEAEFVTESEETEFTTGEYPQWYYWDDIPANSTGSYVEVYSESEEEADYFYYWTPEEDGTDAHDPIVISGGIDDGETITFKFNGDLTYEYYDTEADDYIEENVSGKFYVKGEIEDISSTPARKKSRRASRVH